VARQRHRAQILSCKHGGYLAAFGDGEPLKQPQVLGRHAVVGARVDAQHARAAL
jgi:hypothetical protein